MQKCFPKAAVGLNALSSIGGAFIIVCMNILLCQTPALKSGFLPLPGKEVPISLLYLASFLRKNGYKDVEVLDLELKGGISPHLEQEIAEFAPKVVGITSYTSNVILAGQIAELVKRISPESITVIGGFHASALPKETLEEFPKIDYLVFGEGEITLLQLVNAIETGKLPDGIAGLAWRRDGDVVVGPTRPFIEDLDELPFPDRSLVPIEKYIPDPGNYFRLPSSGILYSRGCPFRCAYCSKSVFLNRIRYRSPANFAAEVRECINRYNIRDFRLGDEGPTTNSKKMGELCSTLIEQSVNITWNCFSRIDTVNFELLSLMKKAGCYHVTYGLESVLPETQKLIYKEIDPKQAAQVVKWTQKLGIECKVNFIFGFPWEKLEDMKSTVRFANKLNPDIAQFHIFKPFPGSELYQRLDADGKIKSKNWGDYDTSSEALVFEAPFSERDIMSLIKSSYFSFYFRPRFILRRMARFLRHPWREIKTVLKGMAILIFRGFLYKRQAARSD